MSARFLGLLFAYALLAVTARGAQLEQVVAPSGAPIIPAAEPSVPPDSSSSSVQSPATSPSSEPSEATELPTPKPAIVETSCVFKAGSRQTFSLTQTEGKKDRLLDLIYKRCALKIDDDGVISLSVDVQAQLNVTADVASCSSFQIGMLFEGEADSAHIGWPGFRKLIIALPVANIDGDKQDLSYFVLNDHSSDQPITIADTILQSQSSPNYPDLYWGTALILQEERTGPLATAIRNNTPVLSNAKDGKPDLKVEVAVAPFTPRGWCVVREPNGQLHKAVLNAS